MLAKATKFAFLGVNEKNGKMKTTIQVKWIMSPAQWFHLNSDGSSMGNLGRAGGGDINRNAEGDWLLLNYGHCKMEFSYA